MISRKNERQLAAGGLIIIFLTYFIFLQGLEIYQYNCRLWLREQDGSFLNGPQIKELLMEGYSFYFYDPFCQACCNTAVKIGEKLMDKPVNIMAVNVEMFSSFSDLQHRIEYLPVVMTLVDGNVSLIQGSDQIDDWLENIEPVVFSKNP